MFGARSNWIKQPPLMTSVNKIIIINAIMISTLKIIITHYLSFNLHVVMSDALDKLVQSATTTRVTVTDQYYHPQ